jgi:threonine synthase
MVNSQPKNFYTLDQMNTIIFSSITSIASFHRSVHNPVANGTVIMAAWVADWISSSPSSEPSSHAL